MKTNEHEVIIVIMNAGFSDDVMDIARQHAVRGGTVVDARGVVSEEAAAFFGITIHKEKELLMMVVTKDIRDDVLNAIYREMGKKAGCIAFSLPVTDVAGLLPPQQEAEETD